MYNNIMSEFSSKPCREGGVWSMKVQEKPWLKLV